MSPSPLLSNKNLHVNVAGKEILKGLNLEIRPGEIHAIMGPNGSGKSTLSAALMGHPSYEITEGTVEFCGENLLTLKPEKRAQKGFFLAFQYPQAIPGVPLVAFLRAAYNAQRKMRAPGTREAGASAQRGEESGSASSEPSELYQKSHPEKKPVTLLEFRKIMREAMKELHLPAAFMNRATNDGFSGGEKKKAEILQMKLLEPVLSVLDETDSGLDIDALKIICENIRAMRNQTRSTLIITHYQRILHYIEPDFVHIMIDGKIVLSGEKELAAELERSGYDAIRSRLGLPPALHAIPEAA